MRNYAQEYKNYQSRPEQKKNRASRNLARRIMKRKLGVKIKGKDIDHKDGNPRNNSRSNLRIMSKSKNRSKH